MIIGIGIDIIELERINKINQQYPKFSQRILTKLELEQWQHLSMNRKIEYLAGRFAAKEALAKALGTGIGQHFSWQDVAILPGAHGAPEVMWYRTQPAAYTHISITHSQSFAFAQAILEEKS